MKQQTENGILIKSFMVIYKENGRYCQISVSVVSVKSTIRRRIRLHCNVFSYECEKDRFVVWSVDSYRLRWLLRVYRITRMSLCVAVIPRIWTAIRRSP